MLFRIALCDDEPAFTKVLYDYLRHYEMEYDIDFQISTYDSGNKLLQEHFTSEPFHIIFLDVEMPGSNGLEIANKIRESDDYEVRIIFISSYPQYMKDSFNVQAFWYLQKPLNYTDLKVVLEKVFLSYQRSRTTKVLVTTESEEVLLRIQDIIYIEVQKKKKNTLSFVLTNRQILSHGVLNDWKQELESYSFVTPYRGLLINLDHIHYIRDHKIIMSNGTELPISRRQERNIHSLLIDHILSIRY